ncbi:BLUF domain-containing protein [Naasia sp. SYSU D00057]|uniref:BLUF domain-containing protein n=1 Tax=Naasia sp. SYSU D00057 TaxID=2817380 RepID=UPI001B313F9A
MFSLIYTSTETQPFDGEQLEELLTVSRRRNGAHGISGMLLYNDGRFMQALEGDEQTVRDAYALISADERHDSLKVVTQGAVEGRSFPEWTMGYRRVGDEDLREVAGYDGFLDSSGFGDESWSSPSAAKLLLDWFRVQGL